MTVDSLADGAHFGNTAKMLEHSESELRIRFGLVPITKMVGGDVRDMLDLKKRYTEARNILQNLDFVRGINHAWFGGGSGIVAVFCFDFRTTEASKVGWVVCGDMPWLFSPFLEQDSSRAMLERYVRLTREWNANGGKQALGYRFGRFHPDWVDEVEARMRYVEDHVLPYMPVVSPD